jgi:hypothetical protein
MKSIYNDFVKNDDQLWQQKRFDPTEERSLNGGAKKQQVIAEHMLVEAIMWQALSDLSDRKHRASVLRWANRRDFDGPFTFDNVCEELGLDAQALRKEIKKRYLHFL